MKKKTLIFSLIMILFFPSSAFANTVFIDPGHGGSDSGAISYDNKYEEKDLNLDTARACIEELEKYGVIVYTSRTGDVYVSLEDRSKMANKIKNLDLFVSIHHNACPNNSVNRGEVIYSVKEKESQELAECISKKLYDIGNTEVKIYNRYNSKGTDYYSVLRNTDATSIIVEISFITSPEGVSLVDTLEKRERNGVLIAQGIMDYLGVDYSDEATDNSNEMIDNKKGNKYIGKKNEKNNDLGLSMIEKVLKNKRYKTDGINGKNKIFDLLSKK